MRRKSPKGKMFFMLHFCCKNLKFCREKIDELVSDLCKRYLNMVEDSKENEVHIILAKLPKIIKFYFSLGYQRRLGQC